MKHLIWSLLLILACSCYGSSYNVLVMFPFPSRSHNILGTGVVKLLVDAGHQVTYITAFPSNTTQPNLLEVDVSENAKYMENDEINIEDIIENKLDLNQGDFMTLMNNLSTGTIRNPNVQKLLNDPSRTFDVIIAEYMFSDLPIGLSAVYGVPFAWLSSVEPHWAILSLVDEVTNPAYVPNVISSCIPPFTFKQRLQELAIQTIAYFYREYMANKKDSETYNQLYGPLANKKGKLLPPYGEVRYSASLVLSNSHVSLGQATRLPQNFIPLAGYHLESHVKPLPENLKKIMDDAKNGVIYFSLGSNVKSKDLPEKLKKSLLNMFASLKQTVIWKLEEELENIPDNVHILKWAPQSGILGHTNCRLFISHGGLLSTIETVHFGVPIIGIPIFGDQSNNVDRAVNKGLAKRVDLSYDMAEKLKTAIEDMIRDRKYGEKAKELSRIFRDRPVPPGRELVHWVEHVVRTQGAPHLRSPALMVPWYQKMYLDFVALLIVILGIFYKLLKLACHKLFTKTVRREITTKKRN